VRRRKADGFFWAVTSAVCNLFHNTSSKDPEGDKQMNKWLNSSEVLSVLPVSTVFNISMAASRILSRVNFHLVSASITKKMYMEAL